MEIDFTRLYDEVKDSNAYTKAYKFADSRHIKNFYSKKILREGEYINNVSSCVAAGANSYDVSINLDENGGYIDSSCTCELKKPCEHIVALSYYFSDVFSKGNVIIEGERHTIKSGIFSKYGEIAMCIAQLKEQEKMQFIPFLTSEKDGLSVRFKVGNSKKYIIKDLLEFALAMKNIANFKYGDKLEFKHNIDMFDEKYHSLVRFVTSVFLDDNSLNVKNNRLGLPFKGEIVDIIFELYRNCQSNAEIDGFSLSMLEKNFEYKLRLEKKEDLFFLSYAGGKYLLIDGMYNSYMLQGEYLYKTDNIYAERIRPLIDIFLSEKQITFEKGHLSEWFLNVLPLIEKFAVVEYVGFDQSEYANNSLSAKLYFDIVNGKIQCHIRCLYGDEPVDIYDKHRAFILKEFEIKKQLEKYFTKKGDNFIIDGEDNQFDFLTEGIFEMQKYFEIYSSDSFSLVKIKKPPNITTGVRVENDLLKITVGFDREYSQADVERILKAYRQKKKYVKINATEFISLSEAQFEILHTLQDISGRDMETIVGNEVKTHKYRALQLDNILKGSGGVFYRDSSFKEIVSKTKNFEDSMFDAGEFYGVMRQYQKTGFRWFSSLAYFGFGGILADDMGLGKSLQAIAYICSGKHDLPSIIVCPSSLILNWQSEFSKFAKDAKVLCVYGNKNTRSQLLEGANDCDVIITSYELLRQDVETYSQIEFAVAVIDEAQYIKNYNTKNAQAVKSLKSKHRFALSGTPIENNISELWSIFDFVMPDFLYSHNKFKQIFEIPIVRDGDDAAQKRLQKMVSPFILRRLKKDVLLELPQKIENSLIIPMQGEQKDLYAANVAEIKKSISKMDDVSKNKMSVLAQLTKLRQICCSPSLVYNNYYAENAKLDAALELVSQSIEGGHKVLIFSQFTSMLDILKKKLKVMGASFYLLQGDTSKDDRQSMVENFNRDDTQVFLLSLRAGGTGLNLTGADIVIHYDPWWNLSAQNQASDRAHRIGQDKVVQVYKLILKDTIEEKIVALQDKKQELFDKIIQKGDVDIMSMSKEQLLDILS